MTPALAALLSELVHVRREPADPDAYVYVAGVGELVTGTGPEPGIHAGERAVGIAAHARDQLAAILRRHPEALRELLGEGKETT
jgi:hypothetical protein